MRKKTIYRQFVISFSLIVLPVIICGCVLIAWQKGRIEEEWRKNVSAEVYYGRKRLEAQVEAIKMFQYYYRNDEELRSFMRQYDFVPVYEYYALLSTVRSRIDIAMQGNPCIEDVVLYFRDIGISVSHSRDVNYISEEEYHEVYQKVISGEGILRIEDNGLYASDIFTYARWDRDFEIIIDICLSKEYIFQDILNQNADRDAVFFLYDYGSEQLIRGRGHVDGKILDMVQAKAMEGIRGESVLSLWQEGQKYLLVSNYSALLNQSVYQCSLAEDAGDLITGYGILVIYLLFSVLVAFMLPRSVKRIVMIPIQRLIDAFRRLSDNELDQQIAYRASDEFNYLYDEFNSMTRRLNNLIDENYKSRMLMQEAQLKQLQAQVHPHFLYNTYFMLHRMILDGDEENAVKLSECLGIFMEYLGHNLQNEVPLTQELRCVRSYLEIQQMRFEERMSLEIEELPQASRNLRVPRLILQPIVENYMKYGYETSDGQGELYIRFPQTERGLCILIGGGCAPIAPQVLQGLKERLGEEAEDEGFGLISVHRRLRIRFGRESGLELSADREGRLVTKVFIYDRTGEGNV